MSWLGAVDVVGGGGRSYQLFVFDDGIVCVRPTFFRALPGALIGSIPGGALSGAVGGVTDSAVNPSQLSKLEAKVHGLGTTASAKKAADVLPRAILVPLDDIVTGTISGKWLRIKIQKRRLFTGFSHTLGGRLAKKDLDAAQKLLATALGPRWKPAQEKLRPAS
jgi:hypothetical protein